MYNHRLQSQAERPHTKINTFFYRVSESWPAQWQCQSWSQPDRDRIIKVRKAGGGGFCPKTRNYQPSKGLGDITATLVRGKRTMGGKNHVKTKIGVGNCESEGRRQTYSASFAFHPFISQICFWNLLLTNGCNTTCQLLVHGVKGKNRQQVCSAMRTGADSRFKFWSHYLVISKQILHQRFSHLSLTISGRIKWVM